MKSNSLSKASVSYLWDFLLYSSLGCISYFLLVNYTDIPVRHQNRLINPEGILAAIILFNGVGISMKYINLKISETYPVFLKRRKMLLLFLAVTAVALLGSNYLLSAFAKIVIGSPFPFRMNGKGLSWLLGIWLVELVIVSQFMVNQFYKNLISLYKRSKELEENNLRAQYTALQNQLNPHFLLNTLNNIYALTAFDTEKAQQAIQELSKLLRYVLYDNQETFVPLTKEVEFIQNYIELMRIRVSSAVKINTNFQIRPDSQSPVAPLLFISLIENAFKHGISPTEPSFIDITLTEKDDEIHCVIRNSNYPKNAMDKSGSGIGLEQVRKRLELLYAGRYEWHQQISSNQKEYSSILTIKIPDNNKKILP